MVFDGQSQRDTSADGDIEGLSPTRFRKNLTWTIAALLLVVVPKAGLATPVRISLDVRSASGTTVVPPAPPAASDSDEAREPPVRVIATREGGEQGEQPLSARLELDGDATLELSEGTWSLEAAADGYWSPRADLRIAKEEGAHVVLDLWPTGRIRGGLEVPDGAKDPEELILHFGPVPDREGLPLPRDRVTCPVEKGAWTCELPAGDLDLRFEVPGSPGGGQTRSYTPVHLWGIPLPVAETLPVRALKLHTGATILGWVTTESGPGVDGTGHVELRPRRASTSTDLLDLNRLESRTHRARISRRGHFELNGIAPGAYFLKAHQEPYAPSEIPVQLVENEVAEIRNPPLMLRYPKTLEVRLEPPTPPGDGEEWWIKVSQLDKDSLFTLGVLGEDTVPVDGIWQSKKVEPGHYLLEVGPRKGEVWHQRTFDVDHLDPEPLLVELPGIEVRGRVFLGDEPLVARVDFKGKSSASVTFESNEDGAFAGLLVAEGDWDVEVASKEPYISRKFQGVEIAESSTGGHVEVELHLDDTVLKGIVVDEDMKPVRGANVRGGSFVESSVRTHSEVHTYTDESGRFEIVGMPQGKAALIAKYEADLLFSNRVVVDIVEAEEKEVQLVVRRGIELRGQVVAGDLGVPGAQIIMKPIEDRTFGFYIKKTDAHGEFDMRLPAQFKEIILTVAAPGFGYRILRASTKEGRLVIPVRTDGGTLIVELSEHFDLWALESPHVYIIHEGAFDVVKLLLHWSRLHGQSISNHERFVIPMMEPGPYSVCLMPRSNYSLSSIPSSCVSGLLENKSSLTLSLKNLN